MGILYSIIAGITMSIQGVMNSRLGDKSGLYEANVFVQGTAFIISLVVMFIFGKGNFKDIFSTSKIYWLGGVLGIVITLTVMLSISKLNPTIAISIILIAQLLMAAIIDCFGIMESKKIAFTWNKICGIILMIVGIILIKIINRE